ncbi:unnamed protein product [Brachionus calyciflorus]|uniref:Reverse transcriptase domain-containing protein n=1 Tax=Brachionus calyciflorus TaxID=104777 RepID=A0A814BJL1_9BILA|nr:unnamed protein product [Brachionus calyciflorus]
MLTAAIFFDLEKAFDRVSHNGIIKKLNEIGLSPCLVRWLINFLSDRSFSVDYKGWFSKEKPINCGVPQGSCLSPTIFILFFSAVVDRLPNNIKSALFADDLCIWTTCKTLKQLEDNCEIWCRFL